MNLDDCIRFGNLTVSLPDLRVHACEKELYLTLTQLRLLLIFLSDPYGQFATSELIRRLQLPSKQSLIVLVCVLRERLDQRYIFTLQGYGYAFALEK